MLITVFCIDIPRLLTWYLILDDVGLGKQVLSYAPFCTIVLEAILEVVNWTCKNHSSWKTFPNRPIHNTLTEKNLIGYSYGSSGLSSWTCAGRPEPRIVVIVTMGNRWQTVSHRLPSTIFSPYTCDHGGCTYFCYLQKNLPSSLILFLLLFDFESFNQVTPDWSLF